MGHWFLGRHRASVYTCSCSTGCSVRLSSVSSSFFFFFFSSSPRHVSPRIVVRGSWMPDDYIDRVGGWSEASKVAANFAIRRNTTSTKKYLLLGRGNRPLIPFSPEPRQIFPIAPGNKSRVDFPLPLVPSSRKITNNSLFLPTRYFSRKKCSRIDGSTHPGYTLFKFALY